MQQPRTGKSPLYLAVWRWHFYAGIFVIPLMLLLSVTGLIYLFKSEFEEWWYRDLLTVQPGPNRLSGERLAAVAEKAFAGQSVIGYSPAPDKGSSVRVLLSPKSSMPGGGGHESHEPREPRPFERPQEVYLDPYTGRILGSLAPDDRIMQIVRNIHGKLLAGSSGELVVEMAAGWMAVLLVSGIYLWWPRGGSLVWGTLLPRWRVRERTFWRDMHSVPAFYTTIGLLFILATGLPWTVVAGGMIKRVSGSSREGPAEARANGFHSQPLAAHSGSVQDWFASFPQAVGAKLRSIPPAKPGQLSLDHVTVIAEANGLRHPFQIAAPRGRRGVYSVRTLPKDPRETVFLHVDQYSGDVRGDFRFSRMNSVAKAVSLGIALHEGRLFGFWNQVLGVIACLGTMVLSTSAAVMWWKRRPAGLGAPRLTRNLRIPRSVYATRAVLSIVFPVAAVSFVPVFLFDRYVLPRFPRLRWALAE